MKLTDKKVSNTRRAIVFGEPKSGKTQLVSQLSEKFNLLYFDLENGYETMLKLPVAWQERIEIVSIPDTKTYPIAIETLLKVVTGMPVEICDEHGKVACPACKKNAGTFTRVCLNELGPDTIVVIDSLTQLSNSAMNFLTKNQEDTYKPEWTDYRAQGQLLDKFLSQIQQAKYNIACITHVVETELEDGKKRLVPTCGTTAFSRNTAKYFDHVVYCEVKNKKHNFASSTCYSNTVLTGSRTDVELEKKDKPTLLDIFTSPLAETVTQVVQAAAVKKVEEVKAETKPVAAEPVKPASVAEVKATGNSLLEKLRAKREASEAATPAPAPVTKPVAEVTQSIFNVTEDYFARLDLDALPDLADDTKQAEPDKVVPTIPAPPPTPATTSVNRLQQMLAARKAAAASK